MIGDVAAYGGVFLTAFLAATLLPAQSEAVLLGLLSTKTYSTVLLIAVASIGNILGSVFNWWIGIRVEHFKTKKWFPVKPDTLEKAQIWYQKYGRWSLFLSWVPLIGDPITVASGVMKERFIIFILIVSAAKIGRYLVVASVIV